jgi:sensor histidine kinase YesM
MNFYRTEVTETITFSGVVFVPATEFPQTFYLALRSQVVELPGKVIMVYLNLFFLLPVFLLKQRYLLYILILLVAFGLVGLVQKYISIYITFPIFYPSLRDLADIFSFERFIQYAAGILSLVGFTSGVKMLLAYQHNQRRTQEMEKRQIFTELQFLKNQLNPHFFFNTLNNLYGMALTDTKQTAAMILRLSEIMHYIVYDSNSRTVSLAKEIELVKSYIQLEKMRYGNRLKESVVVSGNPGLIKIPPLILLPLVENAFKHGATQETETALINVIVNIDQENVYISIENSKSGHRVAPDHSNGVGLENVKRRLALLYPQQHDFRVFDEKDNYLVVIRLKHT